MTVPLKKFATMFATPPSNPAGKEGTTISYLNPITDTHDVRIDFGIMDSAWFLFHPNESKKFCDVKMSSYTFINLADAIAVHGAKNFLNWVDELVKQIRIIHAEYMSVVGDRAIYNDRVPNKPPIENATPTVATLYETTDKFNTKYEDYKDSPIAVPPQDILVNSQGNIGSISLPFDYAQPCTMVEGMTTAKYPPETRKWIHHLRYIHPLVDDLIMPFLLYDKVSEHMGENVITYNSDTCSVELFDWHKKTKTEKNIINPECVFAYGTPHHLREIMRERMIETEPDEINEAWTELNGLMSINHPIETFMQTEPGTGLWMIDKGLRDARKPHGLIAVNDYWYWIDYIDPIKIPVADDLFGYLKDACQLVNHMYPLENRVRSERRYIIHEPLLIKTVEQEWTQYAPQAAVGGGGKPAAIDVVSILGKWGYADTEIFPYDWPIGVGLAIEETYPRKKIGSGTFETDLVGNKIKNTANPTIDDRNLVPEEVIIPIA